jgi:uncharacterized protein (DUF305 family)
MLHFVASCALVALLLLPINASACLNGDYTVDCAAMQEANAPQVKVEKTAPITTTTSTEAFEAANAAMHENMMIDFTGDADVDFVRAMIPHHQGAVDMAKVLLDHGKDPELQKLGHDIIEAQTKEIAQMQTWLTLHTKK